MKNENVRGLIVFYNEIDVLRMFYIFYIRLRIDFLFLVILALG